MMNKQYGRRHLVAGVLAAASLMPAITMARAVTPATEARSVTVRYADLNLSSDAGIAVLYRRLQNASRQVCGDHTGKMPLAESRRIRQCFDEALTRAVAFTGNARLASLHWR